MNIEIRDSSLQARLQKQLELTGSENLEALLARLLETQEEQDRWLLDNRAAIDAKIRRGLDQIERGQGISEGELDERLKALKTNSQ
jgi:DNA-binding phage protein